MHRAIARVLICVVLLGMAGSAYAVKGDPPIGKGQGMDGRLFRSAVDTKGHFTIDATPVQPHLAISFGLILDFGFNQWFAVELDDEARADTFAYPFIAANLFFNIGLFDRLVVGLGIPVALPGGEMAQLSEGVPDDDTTRDWTTKGAFGDISIHAKMHLTRANLHLVGLGLLLQYNIPSGADRYLMGDPGGGTFVAKFIMDVEPLSRYRAALNVGARVPLGWKSDNYMNDVWSEGNDNFTQEGPLAFHYGPLAYFGLGQSITLMPGMMDFVLEVYSTHLIPEFSDRNYTSLEINGGFKIFVEENSYLMAGYAHGIPLGGTDPEGYGFQNVEHRLILGFAFEPSRPDADGDGIFDSEDDCPYVPEDRDGFEDTDGCPENDNDKDGIPDRMDHCPLVPEDFDDDADGDGCPEDDLPPPPPDAPPDRDNDRILDENDQCPDEPETYNGTEDDDGCPDEGDVVVTASDITILKKVFFEYNSDQISKVSYPILDTVALTIINNPQINLVEVQGHADERGGDRYNLVLTTKRAASVVRYLVNKGVSRKRMRSMGYGEYCPVDMGKDAKAYDANRRVEFKIIMINGMPTGVDPACPRARRLGVIPK